MVFYGSKVRVQGCGGVGVDNMHNPDSPWQSSLATGFVVCSLLSCCTASPQLAQPAVLDGRRGPSHPYSRPSPRLVAMGFAA